MSTATECRMQGGQCAPGRGHRRPEVTGCGPERVLHEELYFNRSPSALLKAVSEPHQIQRPPLHALQTSDVRANKPASGGAVVNSWGWGAAQKHCVTRGSQHRADTWTSPPDSMCPTNLEANSPRPSPAKMTGNTRAPEEEKRMGTRSPSTRNLT